MESEKKRKAPEDLIYFRKAPAGVVDSADVLLILDSGEEMPVHSAFLCAHSQTFYEILSASKAEGQRRLPLPSCDLKAALVFLQYLYAADTGELLKTNEQSARCVAAFAHKFAMASVLDQCDKFLAAKVQDVYVRTVFYNRACIGRVWYYCSSTQKQRLIHCLRIP